MTATDPATRRARPTIDDVAREAGLSKGTVSRVLNDRNWVSPESREAVLSAVQRTGFVANATARSLALRRTGSIALVLGAPATQLFTDPNYAMILQVITDALAEADYSLVFMTASGPEARQRLVRYLRGGHVDGAAYLSAGESETDELVRLMEEHPIPFVVTGHPFLDDDPLPFVAADEVKGGHLMGQHFIDRDYRHIGIIATHLEARAARARVGAFRAAVGPRSRRSMLVEADEYSVQSGREAMRILCERSSELDAVFATSDVLAAGALEMAHELGLRVPQDIAIAGFDDSPIARQITPQLTTVRQDISAVARELVALLLSAISGGPLESRVLPVELIVRDSA